MTLSLATVGAKITAAFINLIIADVNAQGWYGVVPTSVAGTGVTVGATGKVTFTGSSAISVNGVYTSASENYVTIFDSIRSANGGDATIRLRASGADDATGSSYVTPRNFINASANTPSTITGTSWPVDAGATLNTRSRGMFFVFGPKLAAITQMTVHSHNSGGYTFTGGAVHTVTTAFDGYSIITGSGTLAGSARTFRINDL